MALAATTAKVLPPADFPKKRRTPVGYRLEYSNGRSIFVPGHYESACGGCDTLPSYKVTFGLIKHFHGAGYHVVFEGLLAAHDKKQTLAVWEAIGRKGIAILELTEPLAVCLDSVKARRTARGSDPETFNPANTERRYAEVVRSCQQLEKKGIPIHRVDRAGCVAMVVALLGLPVTEEVAA